MRKKLKKGISGILIFIMLLSLGIPSNLFAAQESSDDTVLEYQEVSDENFLEKNSENDEIEKYVEESDEKYAVDNQEQKAEEDKSEGEVKKEGEEKEKNDDIEESIYVDQHDLISTYALDYAETVTNSHLMEDTGIRIKDAYVTVNVTLQGNLKWTVRDFKDVSGQNMIISTNSDGFFTNTDKITIDYKNVGTYKGKSIGIKTVLYPANLTSAEKTLFKQVGEASNSNGAAANLAANYSCVFLEDTHVYAYKNKANFLHGIRYANAPRMQVSYEIYYSDTGDNINAESMYFTWGSQNMGEGISSNNAYTEYYKMAGAYPEVYTLSKTTKAGNIQFTNSLTSYTQGYTTVNPAGSMYYYYSTNYKFLANCITNDFEDNVNGSDFWKSAASMHVASDDGIYRFRMLSKSFWFVPMLAPIGATAPEPVKSITEGNSTATIVERKAGQEIEFNVSQQVETYGYIGSGYMKYSNFSLYDSLPTGVDYQSAKVVRIYNGATTDVTNKGSLSYDASTRKVNFSFNSSYVSNEMPYQGETYILKIKCTLRSDAAEKITNKGYSVICNDTQMTNEVIVNHPMYQITTDVENGTVSESASRIEKGSAVKVTYSPKDGYYLKQILVDGKSVSLMDYKDSYLFSNIMADHTIKVVYEPYYSISGRTWEDSDRDGQQKSTEAALNGVTVQLMRNNENGIYTEVKDTAGKNVAITTQNAEKIQSYTVQISNMTYTVTATAGVDGSYQFTGFPEGIYGIRFSSGSTNLVKYTASPENQGDDKSDSDAVPNYMDELLQGASIFGIDTSNITTLENSYFTSSHNDAGFYLKRGSITIKKIGDNGNALQGTEFRLEKKESGRWIELTFDNNMTDGNGKLVYGDLEPGNYRITEVNSPAGNTLLKKQIEVELPYEKDAADDPESANATYTENGKNYYLDVTYTIQNGQNFGMPISGGHGIRVFLMIGFILITIAGCIMAKQRSVKTTYNKKRR